YFFPNRWCGACQFMKLYLHHIPFLVNTLYPILHQLYHNYNHPAYNTSAGTTKKGHYVMHATLSFDNDQK
ncbi:MAG: hypothetical protein Q8K36_02435, partial [Alphaproteobacteria bacterium]|nr:hypothetical protein [Alphaproteobacteria bacterium]